MYPFKNVGTKHPVGAKQLGEDGLGDKNNSDLMAAVNSSRVGRSVTVAGSLFHSCMVLG